MQNHDEYQHVYIQVVTLKLYNRFTKYSNIATNCESFSPLKGVISCGPPQKLADEGS